MPGPGRKTSRGAESEAFRGKEKPLSQFSVFTSSDAGMAGMHLCGLAEATKPGRQVHLYEPSVLVHFPFWHRGTLSLMSSHSLMSAGKRGNDGRRG